MNYTMNNKRKQTLIIVASFQIISILASSLLYQFMDYSAVSKIVQFIFKISHLLAFGYILYALFDYFKFYKLKLHQTIVALLFVHEVFFTITFILNQLQLLNFNFISISPIVWSILFIVWIVFLIRMKEADYVGIKSIRKYAIFLLIMPVLLGVLHAMIALIIPSHKPDIYMIVTAIPCLFILEFARKLGKQATIVA